ncbi:MAG: single-stranded DNA-binding protein [Phycisphaerae bacterium]
MANFNKVILAGNLTRDPQLSTLPSGMAVVEFGMAINHKWRDQRTNEMREDTCFVDLQAYGRQAETLNQYMSKGRPLLVEGRLKYDQWEGKDGTKRSKLRVVVTNSQFLGSPGGRPSSPDNRDVAPVTSNAYNEAPPMEASPPVGDDVPF